MSGEIIEVCQDCGHLIEPEIINDPYQPGVRYKITLCRRDECLAEQLSAAYLAEAREAAARRVDAGLLAYRWSYVMSPPVLDPRSITRITGA